MTRRPGGSIAADVRAGAGARRATCSRSTSRRSTRARPTSTRSTSCSPTRPARAADEVDAAVARGDDPGPLAGVPIALKDNMCTRGIPTTCSSRILEGWRPPYDATVVRARCAPRARSWSARRTSTSSRWAPRPRTPRSARRATRTTSTRVPGGSSGGSAAAVAAGFAPLALGSDTGGSIRQPAALCGVVGVKPTYGAVSRYGLIAFASSLDQIGPFAATVDDAALLLEVIGGHDPLRLDVDRRAGAGAARRARRGASRACASASSRS